MATKKVKREEAPLTEENVWSVIEFARAYTGMYGQTYLNPELVSARMRDVTLNPMAATEETLNQALRSPKESEREIRDFSQSFELTSMVYKRLVSYLADMLSFDINILQMPNPMIMQLLNIKKI